MSDLLDLEAAQARLIALANTGPPVLLPYQQALNHYLAADLIALRTQPEMPLSAMDGWAVRQADMPGPWRIVGESAAGHPFSGRVDAGQTVRISTGAVLPNGSDMVVVQEQCERVGDTITFSGAPPSPLGRHVRREGLDFRAGSVVLEQGTRITPAALALAISAGHASLPVYSPPKVAVIDSGDELVPAGSAVSNGQIPASNGPMLAAMLASFPCKIVTKGPVSDNIDAIARTLDEVGDADLVITTGGASVGDHDLVQPALASIGAKVDFWRVAIKPGKPIMVAARGRQVIIGLPGNPVSSFVTATLFALPFVRALLGDAHPVPQFERMNCTTALPATGKRAEFLRARFVGSAVEPVKIQDSGALVPLAAAQALICRERQAAPITAGENVRILRL